SGVELEEIPRRPSGGTGRVPSAGPILSAPPRAGARPGGGLDVASIIPVPLGRTDEQGQGAKPEVTSIRSVAQTVRVDIHKLDRLMNIVGELAIVRTSLTRLIERLRSAQGDRELAADLHRLQRTFDRHLASMQQ